MRRKEFFKEVKTSFRKYLNLNHYTWLMIKSLIWFSNDFQLRVWKWVKTVIRLTSQRTSAVVVIIFNMYCTVEFSHSVVSNSLRPYEPQHARPPCPSPTPRVYPNSCPLSWWCHLTISSSVVPFSSSLQSFPTSGSFQMSQHFASDGQNIGVSASTSVLPMNTQDWFPLGWTGWISLQSKGLSRVFSKHCAKPFIGIISFNL